MRHSIREFLHNEDGATAIEYGLICAFMVLVVITGMTSLGTNVGELFQQIVDAFP